MTAVLLALQLAAAPPAIGVAASAGAHLCAALPGRVEPGTRLTLVRPLDPQSVVEATVAGRSPTCARLEHALVDGPYYTLTVPAGLDADGNGLWIAFPGVRDADRREAGAVVVFLSADQPSVRVKSCTSTEGLHLTVWSGEPLTGRRLWHQYFYLGHDVEPNCDEREVRAPSARPSGRP